MYQVATINEAIITAYDIEKVLTAMRMPSVPQRALKTHVSPILIPKARKLIIDNTVARTFDGQLCCNSVSVTTASSSLQA